MLLNSLGLDSRLHGAMAGPGEYVVNGMVSDLGAQLGSGALSAQKAYRSPHCSLPSSLETATLTLFSFTIHLRRD